MDDFRLSGLVFGDVHLASTLKKLTLFISREAYHRRRSAGYPRPSRRRGKDLRPLAKDDLRLDHRHPPVPDGADLPEGQQVVGRADEADPVALPGADAAGRDRLSAPDLPGLEGRELKESWRGARPICSSP